MMAVGRLALQSARGEPVLQPWGDERTVGCKMTRTELIIQLLKVATCIRRLLRLVEFRSVRPINP
jgi:hypothetical protein